MCVATIQKLNNSMPSSCKQQQKQIRFPHRIALLFISTETRVARSELAGDGRYEQYGGGKKFQPFQDMIFNTNK